MNHFTTGKFISEITGKISIIEPVNGKYKIVVDGNIAKFSQNPELGGFLKKTRDKILVEASPYDRIWGIGMAQDNPDINNPFNWNGSNLLGFALMDVRKILWS